MLKQLRKKAGKIFAIVLSFLGIGLASNYSFALTMIEIEAEIDDQVYVNKLTVLQPDGTYIKETYEVGSPDQPTKLIDTAKTVLREVGLCENPDQPLQ